MTRTEVLDNAKSIVTGHREEEYGSPEDNFKKIATLWGVYLRAPDLTAQDVAVMMILFKIARLATGKGTGDCWVDIAGYAACGCEVNE